MAKPRRTTYRRRRVGRAARTSPVRRALLLAPVPVLLAAVAAGVALDRSRPDIVPAVAADTPYTISGHGHGHGRGMGQWGAYGYAKNDGWSAERIVAHYYGGTHIGDVGDRYIGVRLVGLDGRSLDVTSDAGARVAGREVAPGDAVHLTPTPGGGAGVVVTKGCDGDVLWQDATDHPWVDPIDPGADRPASELLTMCGGNAFRGSLGVALDGSESRVLNHLGLEDYLLGVVPAEAKAEWADSGGKEALRAQAIAARSYAAVEHRYPYAETCDTQDCQVYGGVTKEDPRTTEAVRTTAGRVVARDGQPVATEFSSSTGGFTAGGVFPAVEDLGDALSPTHDWTQATTAGRIASAFEVGELRSITVVGRNDVGADGGRVTELEVAGTGGTVRVSGPEARTRLGIKSDWFTVTEGIAAGPAPDPRAAPEADDAPVEPTEIEKKYAEIGGPAGPIGTPIGPEMMMPDEVGKFRMFTGGAIVWTPGLGAQVIDAGIVLSELPDTGSVGGA